MAKPNPFAEEKLETREWHDRLGDSFWKMLHRSALFLEELDAKLADKENSPCPNYASQLQTIPQGLAIISVLDYDDMLFLPRELSLAAIHRGVTVEQFVGQWLGNLLDPGKGRLPSGMISAEAFRIVPDVGKAMERLEHAIGIALAMRISNHPKIVVVPISAKNLRRTDVMASLRLVVRNKAPVAFVILDGDGSHAANTVGLRNVESTAEDFLTTLKFLKGQLDRTRGKREPVLISFSNASQETRKLSDIVKGVLDKKGWAQDENLLAQVRSEINYGVDRAKMIPIPPKNTVIQDVRFRVEANLEEEWAEWRRVHGK